MFGKKTQKDTTFYPKTAEERNAVEIANLTGSLGALNGAGLTVVTKNGTTVITRVGSLPKKGK